MTKALFNGDGYGLWVTNGTTSGTRQIIVDNAVAIDPSDMTVFGKEVLFSGTNAFGFRGLWVTNGTTGGTHEIAVNFAFAKGVQPIGLTVLGKEALFAGSNDLGHIGLWVTDGTAKARINSMSVAPIPAALRRWT